MISGILIDLLYMIIVVTTLPFWIHRFRSSSFRKIASARLKPEAIPSSQKKTLWLHAVSVGEVKSLLSFIKDLSSSTEYRLILSVTTVTGYKFAKESLKEIKVIPSPLDFSLVVKKFFNTIEPDILILNELEIWPNWLLTAKKRKVPVILINGRISTPAFRKYRRSRYLMAPVFGKISRFYLQADIYVERFLILGVPEEKIEVTGNIKADEALSAIPELENPQQIFEKLKICSPIKDISLFASTHPEDIHLILPALQKTGQIPAIIVPRHPDDSENIRTRLSDKGLEAVIWSETESVNINQQILIFDQIGYLFNIMKIAERIYMGGTCSKETGGHNLYEPAALNKFLIGNIHNENFPVIFKKLKEHSLYIITQTPDQLASELTRPLNPRKGISGKEIVNSLAGTNRIIGEKLRCLLKD